MSQTPLPPLRVPPADPRASYLALKEPIDAAVAHVLEHGFYILGDEVAAFEREFAAWVGATEGVGVNSGTDAIQLALRTLGIGPGDRVVTVSHTAVATVAAIELTGATAVMVDIDPVTYTMDPAALEVALQQPGSSIKAVVVVHLYGHPADMAAIVAIARQHGLFVIEDCAQAHGATVDGRRVGAIGDIGCFSFYPTKNLGAFGDGGAMVTSRAEWADQARMLRQYGWRQRYISDIAGANMRLDELQAAILRVKLRHLDSANARRRAIAARYDAALASTPLTLPAVVGPCTHAYHQYTVTTPRRDELATFLRSRGIGTAILYPEPVHRQPAYRSSGLQLPHTERVCRELLCLPVHPELTDAQVGEVVERIGEWSRGPVRPQTT